MSLNKTGAVTLTAIVTLSQAVPMATAVLTPMVAVNTVHVAFMLACRLWVHDEMPSQTPFALRMLRVASAAPAQYIKLMEQSGIHTPQPHHCSMKASANTNTSIVPLKGIMAANIVPAQATPRTLPAYWCSKTCDSHRRHRYWPVIHRGLSFCSGNTLNMSDA